MSDPQAAEEPSLLNPKILLPFLLVSLIWGSTWLVIKDQISDVPPSWSVSYRFVIAALAMGYDTLTPILVTAAAGFVVAFPVSWIVAKQLYQAR